MMFLVAAIAVATWIIYQYYLPNWQNTKFNFAGVHFSLPQFGSTQNSNNQYAVSITASNIDEMFRQANIPNVENIRTKITSDQIEASGNTTTSIKAPVFIAFKPVINSTGDLTLEVREVTVAGIRMMPLMTDVIRQQIANSIVSYTHDQFSGKITKIDLKSDEMTVWVTPGK